MKLNEVRFPDVDPIDGYGPGFFRVGGKVLQGSVLVRPETGAAVWGGLDDVAPLLALRGDVDVLIVGTGPEIAHLPPALQRALDDAGIGAEVMASPTAARTYNVLLSEGRRIAAALLPV